MPFFEKNKYRNRNYQQYEKVGEWKREGPGNMVEKLAIAEKETV